MNKKIFATALFALAAFVSSGASAAVTFGNSVNLASSSQTADAVVGQGGTARGNDITAVIGAAGASPDLPKDGEIIVRLPTGLNFDGTPYFRVSPATSGAGLSLKDSSSFGDPTLGEVFGTTTPTVGVSLYDTDGDGGMDRAVAVAAANAAVGDTLTISITVKAASTATVGNKDATVTVNGAASTVRVVAVQKQLISTGANTPPTASLTSASQTLSGNLDMGTSTSVIFISVPKGTKDGKTITLTPNNNVQWRPGTSTITMTTLSSFNGVIASTGSVANSPLTGTLSVAGGAGATSAITLTVDNAPATGLPNDTVVKLVVDIATLTGTATAKVGEQGLTVAGTAGVTGKVSLFNVAANGSTAALGGKVVSLVSKSPRIQSIGPIVITELFDGDAIDATGGGRTPTVTITAGAGLKFDSNTTTISVSGATIDVANGTSTATVIKLAFSGNGSTGSTKTVTINGINVTGSSTGDLAVTIGGATIDSQFGPKGDKIVVAKGVAQGTVTVAGPKTLTKAGPSKVAKTAIITLTESTYGAITRANVSQTTSAYFSLTATNGGKITGVTTSNARANGLTIGTCQAESTGSATYICPVTAESSSLQTGTDTLKVTVAFTGEKAVVGDTISVEVGGTVGASGTVEIATILESTTVKITGGTTQVKEGLTESQKVSGFVISQAYTSSLSAGSFRLIAPAGVKFAGTPQGALYSGTTATATVSTFNTNDTLVISTGAPTFGTSTLTITAPSVTVSGDVSGDIAFELVDGNITGDNKIGLTAESLTLGYADKTLKALSGGKDVALKVDYSKTQEIVGGLVGDGYTVKSSSTPTVTVSVSGSTMTIKGVAAGAANITVTDSLGQTDVVAVTVETGAAIPAAAKATKGAGDRTGVTFGAGASSDGGATYGTTFSADDAVTIIATVGVDATDVGKAGAIHVAGKLAGGSFVYLDEDGLFATWNPLAGLPGATVVTDSLKASYTVTVVNASKLPVGKHRFALAYSTGGKVIYTGKALEITITE
ncbi:hypothetical protein N8600_01445 [Gammaproteobacteria bacterium]|nr:hypothetical protein [Gammaproteobacteria bacterium]